MNVFYFNELGFQDFEVEYSYSIINGFDFDCTCVPFNMLSAEAQKAITIAAKRHLEENPTKEMQEELDAERDAELASLNAAYEASVI